MVLSVAETTEMRILGRNILRFFTWPNMVEANQKLGSNPAMRIETTNLDLKQMAINRHQ